jgi:hypothetical protein
VIREPSAATLKKYGMTLETWASIVQRQGHACAICVQVPSSGRLCIDHDHVKGWKKMPPAKRRVYVRGVVCWRCNHYYLGRGISIARARNVVSYLEAYAQKLKTREDALYSGT